MKLNPISMAIFLTRTEFLTRHVSSGGGLFWTFFSPLISIVVIWFALDMGLGMRGALGPDYGRSLAVGLSAWLFFSAAVINASLAISGNTHLVKKVVFPVFLLPLSKVLVQLIIHTVVVVCLAAILWWSAGFFPGWRIVLIVPAMIGMALLCAFLGLLVASLQVVYKDTQAIVTLIVGLMFWTTPIIWPLANLPEHWHWVVYLSPIALFMDLYRMAILAQPIPIGPELAAVGIASLSLCSILAVVFFRRLRPVFADVI